MGELSKEIDLSEKQGTGITKILRELRKNGSPDPEFDMDEDRTYLETILYIQKEFDPKLKVSDKVSDKEKMFYRLLLGAFVEREFVTTKTMSEITGMAESTTRRYLLRFRDLGVIRPDGKNRGTKYYLSVR
ncbi:MAG: hypothetical protein HFH98_09245 [Lachnospiraceae bacterium]|nr:hypothetical protein [Lachnospiraceae bacterium]